MKNIYVNLMEYSLYILQIQHLSVLSAIVGPVATILRCLSFVADGSDKIVSTCANEFIEQKRMDMTEKGLYMILESLDNQ